MGKQIGIDFSQYDLFKENVSGLTGRLKCKCWKCPVEIHLNGVSEPITIEAICKSSGSNGIPFNLSSSNILAAFCDAKNQNLIF